MLLIVDFLRKLFFEHYITEENVRFILSLIKEVFDGTKVNENVEKPSFEAFGMTILAVMSYQTTPWEELAKKPSIRKTLKYIAIRGNNHYDEMEALTKELIRKHFDGITQRGARQLHQADCLKGLC